MKKDSKEKISSIFFLMASICYYISAIIDIVSELDRKWIINLCLGTAFLCLSLTQLKKNKKGK